MAKLDLIDFACGNFFYTERNDMEFFVALQPSTDKSHIVNSWRHMEASAANEGPGLPF